MKNNEIAFVVNQLRNIAIKFHDHQSLREKISNIIVPLLQKNKLQTKTPNQEQKLNKISKRQREVFESMHIRKGSEGEWIITVNDNGYIFTTRYYDCRRIDALQKTLIKHYENTYFPEGF